MHPFPSHHSGLRRSTHKATSEEWLWGSRYEEKDPADIAGKHSGSRHQLALATSSTLAQAEQNLSVFMAWKQTSESQAPWRLRINNKKTLTPLLNDISWPSNSHDRLIKEAAHICRLVGEPPSNLDTLTVPGKGTQFLRPLYLWKAALYITNVACIIFTWHNTFWTGDLLSVLTKGLHYWENKAFTISLNQQDGLVW